MKSIIDDFGAIRQGLEKLEDKPWKAKEDDPKVHINRGFTITRKAVAVDFTAQGAVAPSLGAVLGSPGTIPTVQGFIHGRPYAYARNLITGKTEAHWADVPLIPDHEWCAAPFPDPLQVHATNSPTPKATI